MSDQNDNLPRWPFAASRRARFPWLSPVAGALCWLVVVSAAGWAPFSEVMQVHQYWPVILLIPAICLFLVGYAQPKLSGESVYSRQSLWTILIAAACIACGLVVVQASRWQPIAYAYLLALSLLVVALRLSKWAFVLALLAAFWHLTTLWSADWGVGESAAAWFVFVLSWTMILIGWISSDELWRWRWNRSIVERVWNDTLLRRSRTENVNGKPHRRWALFMSAPGNRLSQHRLRIVEAAYRQALDTALCAAGSDAPNGEARAKDVTKRFRRAAGSFLRYLQWPAQETQLSEIARRGLTLRTRCEMLAVHLYALQHLERPTVEERAADRRLCEVWLDEWPVRQADSDVSILSELFQQLVSIEFHSGSHDTTTTNGVRLGKPAFLDLSQERKHVADCLEIATRAASTEARIAGSPIGVTFARLWIALSRRIRPQARLDTWQEISRICVPDPLIFGTLNQKSRPEAIIADARFDISTFLAVHELAKLYTHWHEHLPALWDTSQQQRSNYFRHTREAALNQLQVRIRAAEANPPQSLLSETIQTPSWPYPEVWSARSAKAWMCTVIALGAIFAAVALGASHPHFGWNRIDHIGHFRPFAVNDTPQSTSGAVSGSLVASGGAAGLRILNTTSRVPRDTGKRVPLLDITAGPQDGSFLALYEDQSLELVQSNTPNLFASDFINVRPWLQAPASSVWKSAHVEDALPRILAADYSEKGLLFGVEGWGLACYRPYAIRSGNDYRPRSWRVVLPGPLTDVAISDQLVWALMSEHGNTKVVVLDRKSLTQKSEQVIPREMRRFDAMPGGSAVARDERCQLWLADQDGESWMGPLLASIPPNLAQTNTLRSAVDVGCARQIDPLVLMGTRYGLFSYDTSQRQIDSLLKDAVVGEVLPIGAAGAASGHLALIATDRGLFRVSRSGENGHPECGPPIDSSGIISADVRHDGHQAVYVVAAGGGFATRTFDPTTDICKYDEVVPALGWTQQKPQPVIRDVRLWNDKLAFGTSNGAFVMDPATHTYHDASSGIHEEPQNGKSMRKSMQLAEFRRFGGNENRLTALADGLPFVWNEDESCWISLDSTARSGLRSLADCLVDGQCRAFGLDAESLIYRYDVSRPYSEAPDLFCQGIAKSLTSMPSQTAFDGDLLPRIDGSFLLLLMFGEHVCRYESRNGSFSESSFPYLAAPDETIVQPRLAGEQVVYLTSHHRLLSDGMNSEGIFGGEGMPYPIGRVTAMAQGNAASVLLAGPEGAVIEYVGQRGRADQRGQISVIHASDFVTDLFTSSGRMMAMTNERRTFTSTHSGIWRELPGVRGWSAWEDEVWSYGDNGIWPFPADAETAVDLRPKYAVGAGMRDFLRKAIYAWQTSANEIAVITAHGEIGAYDAVRDVWRIASSNAFTRPTQFVRAGEDKLIVVDSAGVHMLSPKLEVTKIGEIPDGAQSVSAHFGDAKLRVAFVRNGEMLVHVWTELGAEPVIFRRGGYVFPSDFSIDKIVFAQPHSDSIVLVDEQGAVATYEPARGHWMSMRRAVRGQRVVQWLAWPDRDDVLFLLTSEDRSTVTFTLRGSVVSAEKKYAISPSEVREQLEAASSLYSFAADSFRGMAKHLPSFEKANDDFAKSLSSQAARLRPLLSSADHEVTLTSPLVRFARSEAGIKFEFAIRDGWGAFPLARNYFTQDHITSVCVTSDGQLWAVIDGRVWSMRTDMTSHGLIPSYIGLTDEHVINLGTDLGGGMVVRGASGTKTVTTRADGALEPIRAASEIEVGRIDMPPLKLQWWLNRSGLELRWLGPDVSRQKQPNIWGPVDGRLTCHVIHSMALDDNGHVLVSTDMGLLVRRRSDFSIVHLYPGVPPARLTSRRELGGATVILVEIGGRVSHVWNGQSWIRMTEEQRRLLYVAETGPWVWRLQGDGKSRRSCVVSHRRDNRIRHQRETRRGDWNFADDIVNWVGRESGEQAKLWLATDDGLWQFDAVRGRLDDSPELLAGRDVRRVRTPTSGDWWWMDAASQWKSISAPANSVRPKASASKSGIEIEFNNPAMRLTYLDGQVTLWPYDKQSPFIDGKMFFDRQTDLCGHQDRLYGYVPNRGLIVRDPENPTRIIAVKPDLPSSFSRPAKTDYRLSTLPDGLRLDMLEAETQSIQSSWKLQLGNVSGAAWKKLPVAPSQVDPRLGPVVFARTPRSGQEFVPLLMPAWNALSLFMPGNKVRSDYRPLEHWWDSDRFAWDSVQSVGILNNGAIVGTTAGGIALFERDSSQHYQMTGLIVGARHHDCLPARDDASRIGILLKGNAAASADYLVRLSEDERPAVVALPQDHQLERQAQIRIAKEEKDNPTITFRESWYTHPEHLTRSGALQSELEELPNTSLILSGQFAFDQADTASPYHQQNRQWLTAANLGEPTGGLLGLNRLERGDSGAKSRLVLQDVWQVKAPIEAVRVSESGEVYVLFRETEDARKWSLKKSRLDGRSLQWTELKSIKDAKLFRIGETVSLDLHELQWSAKVRYHWHRAEGKPVFVTTPAECPIFVNHRARTESGVAFSFDVITSLALDAKRNQFAIGTLAGVLVGAYQPQAADALGLDCRLHLYSSGERTRAATERVRFDAGGELISLAPGVPWDPTDDSRMTITADAIELDGSRYQHSNDAWWLDRQPLEGIITVGKTSDGSTWLISRDHGVFKVP